MGIGALIVDDQHDARQLMRVVIEEANGELFDDDAHELPREIGRAHV